MGGGKLLLTALPEELGAAIQLASVLWLNNIQQTTEMSLCCVRKFTYSGDVEIRDHVIG